MGAALVHVTGVLIKGDLWTHRRTRGRMPCEMRTKVGDTSTSQGMWQTRGSHEGILLTTLQEPASTLDFWPPEWRGSRLLSLTLPSLCHTAWTARHGAQGAAGRGAGPHAGGRCPQSCAPETHPPERSTAAWRPVCVHHRHAAQARWPRPTSWGHCGLVFPCTPPQAHRQAPGPPFSTCHHATLLSSQPSRGPSCGHPHLAPR